MERWAVEWKKVWSVFGRADCFGAAGTLGQGIVSSDCCGAVLDGGCGVCVVVQGGHGRMGAASSRQVCFEPSLC